MPTSRTDFNETWLEEMPMGIGISNTFKQLEYNILERIHDGTKVHHLSNDLYKITGSQIIYYWYGTLIEIILAVELTIKPQGLMVNAIGKDPKYQGTAPYASDLYNAILDDNHRSIRLLSDEQLSDEGYSIWKKLYGLGHKISVYDKTDPGQSFKLLTSLSDLDQYFKQGNSAFKKYQFVLSESGENYAETHSYFNTRRMRELCGFDLED